MGRHRKKRGQASLEYMVIIGFSVLLVIPLIIMYANEKSDLDIKVNSNQAQLIERKICDAAESVYYLGEPSKTRLKVYMPKNIEEIYFTNNTLMFMMRAGDSITEIPRVCLVNLTENISFNPGYQFIYIEADNNSVLVYN